MYRIREMKDVDIPRIAQIEAELFSDGWSEASLRSSLAQPNVKMIVAETEIEESQIEELEIEELGIEESQIKESQEGKQILGYHIFYTSMDEGDVARIAVVPSHRRMGIGEALLEYMWEYCTQEEITRALLEVRASNVSAISLYEKQGFQSLGLRKSYYQNPLEDGVIMEKQIDITTRISGL